MAKGSEHQSGFLSLGEVSD